MRFKALRKIIARSCPFFLRKHLPNQLTKHLHFEGIFEARLFGKKITKLVSLGHEIENEIYWNGFENSLEGKSYQLWAELIETYKPSIIWDIGANSGTYGLLAKGISPQSRICFFEPLPNAIIHICENLRVNGYDEKVFGFALGDYDGNGRIYLPLGNNFPTSVTVNRNTTRRGQEFDVLDIEVHRIDSLVRQGILEAPQLVKMDVETFEPEVLSGFGSLFPYDCIYLIEILESEIAIRLEEFFSPQRYVFYNVNDREKTFRQTSNLSKSDHLNYMIIPQSIHEKFSRYQNEG